MNEKSVIFGVKKDGKYHYIGKTTTRNQKKDGSYGNPSYLYVNDNTRPLIGKDTSSVIEQLAVVPNDKWFDKKLSEVVAKYKDDNPLTNAQWMLDGKRGLWEGTDGYWKGKKRDAHTLQRLSESKFRRVVEYNDKGELVKIWANITSVGVHCFNNGTTEQKRSRMSHVLSNKLFKTHFREGSYWFKESDIINLLGSVPQKINLKAFKAHDDKVYAQRKYTNNPAKYRSVYCVIRTLKNGREIKYDNIEDCSKKLKLSVSILRRIINGKNRKKSPYCIRYGEKSLQPVKK